MMLKQIEAGRKLKKAGRHVIATGFPNNKCPCSCQLDV